MTTMVEALIAFAPGERELPEGWTLSRFSYEVWVRARLGWRALKADEYVDEGFAFLSTPDIKGKAIEFNEVNFITKERYEESPEIQLQVGDVLLAKDGSTLGTVNVVRELPRPATVNSSIAVLTPNPRVDPIFLYYSLQGSTLTSSIAEFRAGMGVPHLFQDDIRRFPLMIPPIETQRQIAEYLDVHTAKIDALVGKQERLIETLAERRQAVISHAVTKGLDPNAPTKKSGAEWLGDIPSGWSVPRVAHHFSITLGKMVNAGRANGPDMREAPYLRAGNVQPYGVDITEVKTMPMTSPELAQLALHIGDLVVVEGGQGGYGRSALVLEDLTGWGFQNHVMRVRPKSGESNAFLDYVLKTLRAAGFIASLSSHSSLPSFSAEKLAAIRYGRPPLSEQVAIVEHLDRETSQIDALSAKAREMIDVLKERRQALISAAVTGKIDVRGLS